MTKLVDLTGTDGVYNSSSTSDSSSSTTPVAISQVHNDSGFSYLDCLYNWKIEAFNPYGTLRCGENVVIKASVWQETTGMFLRRASVSSIVANFFYTRNFAFSTARWSQVEHFQNLSVATTAIINPSFEEWRYDPYEYNFYWIPDQSSHTLLTQVGTYYLQLYFNLTGGKLPLVITSEFNVE